MQLHKRLNIFSAPLKYNSLLPHFIYCGYFSSHLLSNPSSLLDEEICEETPTEQQEKSSDADANADTNLCILGQSPSNPHPDRIVVFKAKGIDDATGVVVYIQSVVNQTLRPPAGTGNASEMICRRVSACRRVVVKHPPDSG